VGGLERDLTESIAGLNKPGLAPADRARFEEQYRRVMGLTERDPIPATAGARDTEATRRRQAWATETTRLEGALEKAHNALARAQATPFSSSSQATYTAGLGLAVSKCNNHVREILNAHAAATTPAIAVDPRLSPQARAFLAANPGAVRLFFTDATRTTLTGPAGAALAEVSPEATARRLAAIDERQRELRTRWPPGTVPRNASERTQYSKDSAEYARLDRERVNRTYRETPNAPTRAEYEARDRAHAAQRTMLLEVAMLQRRGAPQEPLAGVRVNGVPAVRPTSAGLRVPDGMTYDQLQARLTEVRALRSSSISDRPAVPSATETLARPAARRATESTGLTNFRSERLTDTFAARIGKDFWESAGRETRTELATLRRDLVARGDSRGIRAPTPAEQNRLHSQLSGLEKALDGARDAAMKDPAFAAALAERNKLVTQLQELGNKALTTNPDVPMMARVKAAQQYNELQNGERYRTTMETYRREYYLARDRYEKQAQHILAEITGRPVSLGFARPPTAANVSNSSGPPIADRTARAPEIRAGETPAIAMRREMLATVDSIPQHRLRAVTRGLNTLLDVDRQLAFGLPVTISTDQLRHLRDVGLRYQYIDTDDGNRLKLNPVLQNRAGVRDLITALRKREDELFAAEGRQNSRQLAEGTNEERFAATRVEVMRRLQGNTPSIQLTTVNRALAVLKALDSGNITQLNRTQTEVLSNLGIRANIVDSTNGNRAGPNPLVTDPTSRRELIRMLDGLRSDIQSRR
jgi:hypothetical protein